MSSELTKAEEERDWYGELGIEFGATDEAISKAFKKLSLKYHPDKNPGDKAAENKFVAVKEAKEFLLEPKKRKAYDEKRGARRRAEALLAERTRNMGQRRRTMREELARKEREVAGAAAGGTGNDGVAAGTARKLTKVEELRQRGAELREQRTDQQRQQSAAWAEARAAAAGATAKRPSGGDDDAVQERQVRVKWSRSKESHSDDTLHTLFKRFGPVEAVDMEGGKGNKALVTFASLDAVDAAVAAYGTSDTMRASYVGERKRQRRAVPSHQGQREAAAAAAAASPPPPVDNLRSFRDHESVVMMRMRQAAERQALKRKIAESEGGGGAGGGQGPDGGAAEGSAPSGKTSIGSPPPGSGPPPRTTTPEQDGEGSGESILRGGGADKGPAAAKPPTSPIRPSGGIGHHGTLGNGTSGADGMASGRPGGFASREGDILARMLAHGR